MSITLLKMEKPYKIYSNLAYKNICQELIYVFHINGDKISIQCYFSKVYREDTMYKMCFYETYQMISLPPRKTKQNKSIQ